MNVSASGIAYRLATLRDEARKCVLLCSNCHAEVEAGVAALPLHLAERTQIALGLMSLDRYTTIRGNSIGRVFGC